jgi:hypothetical protein
MFCFYNLEWQVMQLTLEGSDITAEEIQTVVNNSKVKPGKQRGGGVR